MPRQRVTHRIRMVALVSREEAWITGSRMGMAIMMIGVVSRNIPITKNSAKISSIRGRPSRLELAKAAATTSDRRVIFTREL